MGWKLVHHAIIMVTGNLSHALKASALPFVLVLLVGLIFPLPDLSGFDPNTATPEELDAIYAELGPPFVMAFLVTTVVSIFVFSWVAVTWHRFILLEEYPGPVPPVNDRPIFDYIWKSIAIGFLVAIAAIPIVFIVLPVLSLLLGGAGTGSELDFTGLVMIWLAGSALIFIYLRLSIILPGLAIHKPMTIGEGWSVTASLMVPIFWASVIIVAFNIAASVVGGLLFLPGSALGIVYTIALQWFTLMVGASLLTTLYGHLVEGRDLV